MDQPGPFWNIRVVIWMAIVSVTVLVLTLSNSRDDAMILALLAFPVIGAGSISHAITNKTVFFWPSKWNTYKWTTFERWSMGIGSTIFATYFFVDMFIRYAK
jgi:hypothetical protein